MKQDFKICTVVHGKTLEAFLKNLKKAQVSATMIELRADSISGFSIKDIVVLKKQVKVPAIFTFRSEKEGGLYKGDASKQKAILAKAFELGFNYVDVTLGNPIVKELSVKEKKHLLLSWHNNSETPSLKELKNMLNMMRSAKPAVLKMASFINKREDIVALAELLKETKKGEKNIVIGMGEKGEITRVVFPSLGSYIAYVTMKGDKNIAPGMLTEEDFSVMRSE